MDGQERTRAETGLSVQTKSKHLPTHVPFEHSHADLLCARVEHFEHHETVARNPAQPAELQKCHEVQVTGYIHSAVYRL